MTHRLKKAQKSLRQTRNFVAGTLIGSAFVTPVFAAADTTLNDWSMLLLLVSVILLGTGLLLRIRIRHRAAGAPHVPQAQDLHESIGQYRPNVFRP
jgi:FtsH-binding integral membrane protein